MNNKAKSGMVGGIVIAVILAVGFLIAVCCYQKIPVGYVGVIYNMNGGVDGEVVRQGWNFVAPTKKVNLYSIGLEQSYLTSSKVGDSPKDESFNIPTSDGKTVRVNLEFSYRFDEERVSDTFIMFKGRSGEEIKDTFIKPKVIAWTQEISANHPVADIFGDQRTAINTELDLYLKSKFDPYGIIIDTVNFTDISVDEETAQAIQQKVNAQQTKELAAIEAETEKIRANKDKEVAIISANKDKEVALINKEKQIIAAQAEAEAIEIAAIAEAEANKLIASSLTPELIDKIKAERWDGVLPKISGNGTTPILNVNDLMEGNKE